MTINHVFIGFMIVIGIAIGALLIAVPQAHDFRVPPYFWILIAMGLFEFAVYTCGKGAPGTAIAMETRLLGFGLAIALMVGIPMLAGQPWRLF
jgi:hypothetical protein